MSDATNEETAPFASPRVRFDGQPLPPMTSYAQNREDVMLRRALQDIQRGFYIDLGAFDPIEDSVTKWFYDCEWRGINVEPNPRMWERLKRHRRRDVNLRVAVGGSADHAKLHILNGEGLSSLMPEPNDDPFFAIESTVDVEVRTLLDIWTEHAPGTVDFLKIDVEGMEESVIKATDFTVLRPRIVVVEATRPGSQMPAWENWEPALKESGYEFVWFDGLNRFYLREEDGWRKRFFELPPSCFDSYVVWSKPQTRRQTQEAALSRRLDEQFKAAEFLKSQLTEAERAYAFERERRVEAEARLEAMHRATIELDEALGFRAAEQVALAARLAAQEERVQALFAGGEFLKVQLAEAERAHAADRARLIETETRLTAMYEATVALRAEAEVHAEQWKWLSDEIALRDERIRALYETTEHLGAMLDRARSEVVGSDPAAPVNTPGGAPKESLWTTAS